MIKFSLFFFLIFMCVLGCGHAVKRSTAAQMKTFVKNLFLGFIVLIITAVLIAGFVVLF